MRVAYIEPIGGFGGMNYYNLGLVIPLSKIVSSIHLFTSKTYIDGKHENLYLYNFFENAWSHKNKLIRFFYYIKAYIKSLIISKRNNCKFVHIHLFEFSALFVICILLIKFFCFKIVLTVHDVESFDKNKNSSRLLEKLIFSLISKFIVHNNHSMNVLANKNLKHKISIIKHGNYIDFYNKVSKNKISNVFKILFFGQIKKTKGLDILLKALSQLNSNCVNFELVIAGKVWRDDFNYYQNIIDENNMNDKIKIDLRYIPNDEVFNHFENTNLVVLPYTEIYQSGVLLLAMGFGRPVLCSDLPGFKEVIEHKNNGFLFKSEDINSLAYELNFIIQNSKILDAIENKAYQDISLSHNWHDIANNTANLYYSLNNK